MWHHVKLSVEGARETMQEEGLLFFFDQNPVLRRLQRTSFSNTPVPTTPAAYLDPALAVGAAPQHRRPVQDLASAVHEQLQSSH